MTFKLITLFTVLVGVLAIGLIRTASKVRQSQTNEPTSNRLQWLVQQARNEGRKEVFLYSPISDYLGTEVTNLDEVLSSCTIVVAQPLESRSYEINGNNLATWTKFKILEPLSEIRPPLCFGCDSSTPPADMLPLQSDEFLVPKSGGTLVRDGIRVTETDNNYPSFIQGQKYLMLISLYPSGVAVTLGGPAGVFVVDGNENLVPVNKEPHALKEGVNTRFQGSLRQVRNKLTQSH